MRNLIAVCLCSLLAAAQTPASTEQMREHMRYRVNQIPSLAKIEVVLKDGTKLRGTKAPRPIDEFVVLPDGNGPAIPVAIDQIQSVNRVRNPLHVFFADLATVIFFVPGKILEYTFCGLSNTCGEL